MRRPCLITDDIILEVLDKNANATAQGFEISGFEVRWGIKAIIASLEVWPDIQNGNYKKAIKTLSNTGTKWGIDYFADKFGMSQVLSIPALAVIPIKYGIYSFADMVMGQGAFDTQLKFYFALRDAGHKADYIKNASTFTVVGEVKGSNGASVYVMKYGEGWLGKNALTGNPEALTGITPAQFYDYAESLYQAKNFQKHWQAMKETVIKLAKDEVRAANRPRITGNLQDAEIGTGGSVTLQVIAEGAGTLTYNWRVNWTQDETNHTSTFVATVGGGITLSM
jgi:hypothetical protein